MNERVALARTVLEHRLLAPHHEDIPVMHRDDRHESASPLDLRHRHLREPDVTDLPLPLQLPKSAELILERYGRIDAVQLVQLDTLEPEAAQAALTGRAQVLRPAVRRPPVRPGSLAACLGCDHQLGRIWVEGLRAEEIGRANV